MYARARWRERREFVLRVQDPYTNFHGSYEGHQRLYIDHFVDPFADGQPVPSDAERAVFCLPLARIRRHYPYASHTEEVEELELALVLLPTGREANEFIRIGIAEQRTDHTSRRELPSKRKTHLSCFIKGGIEETIVII